MMKRKSESVEEVISKKKSKVSSNDKSISEEICENGHLTKQPCGKKAGLTWPDFDIMQLVENIEKNVPEDDNVSYNCRLEKINWENVVFKSYSVAECQEVWNTVHKQIRKFRLLKEITTDIKKWIQTPKASSSKDVRRHPEMPKLPANSYMCFASEMRSKLMQEFPNLTSIEIAKKLGEQFQLLSLKDRERYDKLSENARQEYKEKLQQFYTKHPEMVSKKINKKSKSFEFEEGQGPPKKPKTPFELFIEVELEKENNSEVSKFTFTQSCRERWNEMTDEDKLFWINWTDKQSFKYQEDLKEYLKEHPQFKPEPIKVLLTKKEKVIKDRLSGKPERPPFSAYNLFIKKMKRSEQVQHLNNKESLTAISEKWKTFSEEEKVKYKKELDQLWEEYEKRLAEYSLSLPPEQRDALKGSRKRSIKKKPNMNKKAEVKERLSKPKVPPMKTYDYFCSVYTGELSPKIAWKKLTKAEKLVYEESLVTKKKLYITQYEQYLKSLSPAELMELQNKNNCANDSSSSDSCSSECSSSSEEEDNENDCDNIN